MEIRAAYATGLYTLTEIGIAYGDRDKRSISEIVAGKRFSHLPLVARDKTADAIGIMVYVGSSYAREPGYPVRRMIRKWIRIRLRRAHNLDSWVHYFAGDSVPEDLAAMVKEDDADVLSTFSVIGKETEAPPTKVSAYKELRTGRTSPAPPVPPDDLCWILTFEIILKKLTHAEYRALVAWYHKEDPPAGYALEAITAILYECRVRRFH